MISLGTKTTSLSRVLVQKILVGGRNGSSYIYKKKKKNGAPIHLGYLHDGTETGELVALLDRRQYRQFLAL